MTERLADLMRAEAEGLDVPRPASGPVLTRGRRLRRRRRTTSALAGLAVLAAIGGTALALGGSDRDRAVDPAGSPAPASDDLGAVFSVGATVYLDGGRRSVTIADTSVKSFYYTSAGLLVRQGDNPWSDGGGAQRFSLVRADGTTSPVSVETEETVHATDPAQPYLAYARTRSGTVEVVVHDVSTDEEVAVVPVPGASASFLPVALSGDLVFLGADGQDFVVDWTTGEITRPGIVRGYPEVAGGHAAVQGDGEVSVVDASTGETLLAVEAAGYAYLSLSPDGRFAKLDADEQVSGFDVYDVVAGTHVQLPGATYDYGWTADGDLFRLQESASGVRLSTCEADTGSCAATEPDLATPPNDAAASSEDYSGELKLGGLIYES
ncbi:hypothetical protein [Nocardioides sp.]|uniref:hypothetical protein n=1 Tax=Nocardioides sp. TaxID=35761 RepID=UPI00286D2DD9|nr:hypothetical protein [Nocardioides sp.]